MDRRAAHLLRMQDFFKIGVKTLFQITVLFSHHITVTQHLISFLSYPSLFSSRSSILLPGFLARAQHVATRIAHTDSIQSTDM